MQRQAFVVVGALLLAAAFGGYTAAGCFTPMIEAWLAERAEAKQTSEKKAEPPASKDGIQGPTPTPTPIPTPTTSPRPPEEQRSGSFRPGAPLTVRNWWYWIFAALSLPLVCFLGWVLSRRPDAVIHDSPQFREALRLWHGVIVRHYATPRELKRFLNSLRYVAMRWRTQTAPPPTPLESLINRVAASFTRRSYPQPARPTLDKEAAIVCVGVLAPLGNGRRVDYADIAMREETVAEHLEDHRKRFGGLPPKEDWDRYYEIMGEVQVR